MNPRISVILATFGAERTIRVTLDSLLAQTERDWEALIVDDASPDGSPAIGEEYARRDSRFRIIRRDNNGGPGAARNTGLDAARGEFVHFLDPDDWLLPSGLAALLGGVTASGLSAACGGWVAADEHGHVLSSTATVPRPGVLGINEWLGHDGISIFSQLVRRESTGDLRFREDLECFEDFDFFVRLAAAGVRWTLVGSVIGVYRQLPRFRGNASFAAKFATVRSVVSDGFALARKTHATDPRVDCSAVRITHEIRRRAVHFATLMTGDDPTPQKDLAAAVLRDAGVEMSGMMDPEAAAAAAFSAGALARRFDANAWSTQFDQLAGTLATWWIRCEREGWTAPGFMERATTALAEWIAGEMDVPAELASQLAPSRPVVVLGLGRNGIKVARELARRGIPFAVRDDGCDETERERRLPGIAAAFHTADAAFIPNGQYLMTLTDDTEFMARLPRGLNVLRWRDAAKKLARGIEPRLAKVIDMARAKADNTAQGVADVIGTTTTGPTGTAITTGTTTTNPVTTTQTRPQIDIFLGSFKRPEKLAAMIESVRATGYPARVLVAAGDLGTIQTCERFPGLVECIYSTEVNQRIGCTAPLNMAFRNLVRHHALFCTDDCVFSPDALDVAVTTLLTKFPDSDGVVGLAQENIVGGYQLAFPLFGRKFLDRFRKLPASFVEGHGLGKRGDIFWPGHFHLFNDVEIGLTIQCMGNWVFEPNAKLRHFHPECGGGEMDATHGHGLTNKQQDAMAWTARRAEGKLWGLDA